MPLTDKEKSRRYYLNNKEIIAKKARQKYLDNRQKRLEKQNQYNLDNKEKLKEYQQSPEGKKSSRISNWKTRGLIWDTQQEIDEIYNRWLISKRCEACDEEYTETNWKCMDHIHEDGIYGKFRNILCNRCNTNTDIQDNKSGVPNVSWNNTHKRWAYTKTINKKTHRRIFPYFIQAVIYKKEYEEKHS